MASLPAAMRRQVLRQHGSSGRLSVRTRRSISSSYARLADPSEHVSGVTQKDLETNPALAAFYAANFAGSEEVDDEEEMATEAQAEQESYPEHKETKEENPELAKLNIRSLFCYKRDPVKEEGSRRSRWVRALGHIPGLLYGGDPNLGIYSHDPMSKIFVKTPWNQLHRETDLYNWNFESRVYELTAYEDPEDDVGTVHRVMPRDVQRHPVLNKLYCTNYLRYFPGRPIKIPIVYINEEESSAMKRGGFIAPVNRYVECTVEDGVPIPEYVELECTDLRLKEVVRMDRIVFPDGVKVSWRVKDPDMFLIGTVFGRRALVGDEEEEGEMQEGEGGGEAAAEEQKTGS